MNTIKYKIKSALASLLTKDPVYQRIRFLSASVGKEISVLNQDNPYFQVPEYQRVQEAVFITGRFRSGSTLLWNIFRAAEGCTSFYEPFNERKWFLEDYRGTQVDNTHLGVQDYWSEYNGLGFLNDVFDEDWIKRDLLMDKTSYAPKMEAYISGLINHSKGTAVLQFNRVDFRLQWLKHHFPKSPIIHIFRNPREQWLSFLKDKRLMNKHDVEQTYVDGFYLNVWCQDLAAHFPFLSPEVTPHPYKRFYYLWKLSYLYGKEYADHGFSFESLVTESEKTLEELFRFLGWNDVDIASLTTLIQAPRLDKSKEYADDAWFSDIESECEYQLSKYLCRS